MNALVEYGTSSSSSDTDEDNGCKNVKSPEENKPVSKLPTPALGVQQGLQNSVFSNPFVQAELAKAAILEKHVKMVPGRGQTQVINGKKICWSHRKGRCRFGHNCKYAHDTDIQKTTEELEADKEATKSIVCEESGTNSFAPPPFVTEDLSSTSDEVWEGGMKRKLRRPGLSQGLVPTNKVLKMYFEQKTKSAVRK